MLTILGQYHSKDPAAPAVVTGYEVVAWRMHDAPPLPEFVNVAWVKASGRELEALCRCLDGIPKPTRYFFEVLGLDEFQWRDPHHCTIILDTLRLAHRHHSPPTPPQALACPALSGPVSDLDMLDTADFPELEGFLVPETAISHREPRA